VIVDGLVSTHRARMRVLGGLRYGGGAPRSVESQFAGYTIIWSTATEDTFARGGAASYTNALKAGGMRARLRSFTVSLVSHH
jgi:hypothetical protein